MLLLLPPMLLLQLGAPPPLAPPPPILCDGFRCCIEEWTGWWSRPPPLQLLGSGSPSFCAAAIASTFERFRRRLPSELGCAPANRSNDDEVVPPPLDGKLLLLLCWSKAVVEDCAKGVEGKTNGESNGGFGVP